MGEVNLWRWGWDENLNRGKWDGIWEKMDKKMVWGRWKGEGIYGDWEEWESWRFCKYRKRWK